MLRAKREKAFAIPLILIFTICLFIILLIRLRNNKVSQNEVRPIEFLDKKDTIEKREIITDIQQVVAERRSDIPGRRKPVGTSLERGQKQKILQDKIIYEPSIKGNLLLQ